MPDDTPVPISERSLRARTLLALRHLHYAEGWTKAAIGRAIGYRDGQMVSRVMRLPEHPQYVALLGTAQTISLAALASSMGLEVLAEAALGSGKRVVPAPETLPGGCAADDDPTAELLALQEHGGCFIASDCDVERARRARILHGVTAVLLQDADLGPPPAGDSLPSAPARVSIR